MNLHCPGCGLDPKSRCSSYPWPDFRTALSSPASDVGNIEPTSSSLNTSSYCAEARPHDHSAFYRFHFQPCMPYARTGRSDAYAQCSQRILQWSDQWNGEEEANGATGSLCAFLAFSFHPHRLMIFAAERAHDKDPTQYLLTLEQMIENDYPIPSYMADVFQKPQGWVETPEEPKEALLTLMEPKKSGVPRQIYAIDCEMVWSTKSFCYRNCPCSCLGQ